VRSRGRRWVRAQAQAANGSVRVRGTKTRAPEAPVTDAAVCKKARARGGALARVPARAERGGSRAC
jgi:hypothetical protein